MTNTEIEEKFKTLFYTADIEQFIFNVLPCSWNGIAARIVESGAEFTTHPVKWAPRWSKIPMTIRAGATPFETHVKSCIYRIHDCIHQLWGLPTPTNLFTEEDRYNFKRAGMCGEVAVLTLTEFVFVRELFELYPHMQEILNKRKALKILREGGLEGKTPLEIALRLDGLLHKKIRPFWVRMSKSATDFCDDYVPMLEADRVSLDHHWDALKEDSYTSKYNLDSAPNSRYSNNLDGLELTTWMIEDFFHLKQTDDAIDRALQEFNRERRSLIVLPENWDG